MNDVVLAGVAGGLRRLFESRGDDLDVTLRGAVPGVGARRPEHMQLGNRVSAMFVDLPVGEPDPVERLDGDPATTEDLKDREQAVGAAFLVDLTAVRGADAARPRGPGRAPPAVLQPRHHQRARARRCRCTAWARGCSRPTRWCR